MIFFCSFFRMIMLREPRIENGLRIVITSWLSPAVFIFIAIWSGSSFSSPTACSSIWCRERSMTYEPRIWLLVWISIRPPRDAVLCWATPLSACVCGCILRSLPPLLLSLNYSFIIVSVTWPRMPLAAPTEPLDPAISRPGPLSVELIGPTCALAMCCLSSSLLMHDLASATDLFFLFMICMILLRRTVFSLSISLYRLSCGRLQCLSRPFWATFW